MKRTAADSAELKQAFKHDPVSPELLLEAVAFPLEYDEAISEVEQGLDTTTPGSAVAHYIAAQKGTLPTVSDLVSIHDLFAAVKAHPDFVFGTVFVTDDVPPEKLEAVLETAKWAEEQITSAGFEFIEFTVDLLVDMNKT